MGVGGARAVKRLDAATRVVDALDLLVIADIGGEGALLLP